MRYERVNLEAIGYELGPIVVSSAELEDHLRPLYERLHIPPGQLEQLTGIVERRWWEAGTPLSRGAIAAGKKALALAGRRADELGALVYAGVCRESFEPATACRIAHALGTGPRAHIYDLSNACLGVLNGIVDLANRIELGQIECGLVVSCESAREIVEVMIERMLEDGGMARFTKALATLTGGSGAVAVVVGRRPESGAPENPSSGSLSARRSGSGARPHVHRLIGALVRSAPEFHDLCRWGFFEDLRKAQRPVMETDPARVLQNGVRLGVETWRELLPELSWSPAEVDRVICHQVGAGHTRAILQALEIDPAKDFTSYESLGNMGTVSLPMTAALAGERGFLQPGHRTAWLGIGSGLSCMMLGLEW